MLGSLTFRVCKCFYWADIVSYDFADDYDRSINEAIKITKYVIYNLDIPEPIDIYTYIYIYIYIYTH